MESKVTQIGKKRGPKSPRGQAVSSRNSERHGLMSSKPPLLLSEDRDKFEKIINSLIDEYNPQTATERMLIEQISMGWLRLYRLWNAEAAACNESMLDAQREVSFPDTIKAAGDLLGKVGLNQKTKAEITSIETGINNAKIAASLPDTERLIQLNRYERHITRCLYEALDRLIALRQ